MSQPNLLDINPDQLFQNHSIADIDQVQKKLQYEIERKREDLRAMVGYVDFIKQNLVDTLIEEANKNIAFLIFHPYLAIFCNLLFDMCLLKSFYDLLQ